MDIEEVTTKWGITMRMEAVDSHKLWRVLTCSTREIYRTCIDDRNICRVAMMEYISRISNVIIEMDQMVKMLWV